MTGVTAFSGMIPASPGRMQMKLQSRAMAPPLIVVEGTLYPLLTRLKNDDLLSYEWVESTQGPPRKYYNLTPQGEIFLSGLETAWEELTNTVNHLKNN